MQRSLACHIIVFFLNLQLAIAAQVLVNCTWPCDEEGQVCVVTSHTIQCRPRRNSQWVLIQPTQSPVFVGETARRNTPCVSSPIPQLAPIVNASATRLLANQSIITWPPVDVNNPLDAYLSDCEAGTFCSSNGICVDSLPDGAACESTHQCSSSSQCIENRCIDTSSSNSNPWDDQQFDKSHTAAVIAAVVVSIVALLVCLVCIAYFYYYYRHQHKYKSEQPQVLSQPVLSNSPSMQQQQLQFHLQCQRWQDPKATPPPPPYTP